MPCRQSPVSRGILSVLIVDELRSPLGSLEVILKTGIREAPCDAMMIVMVKKKAVVRGKSELRRISQIVEILSDEYRGAECALVHANAFQLLMATILSAQCTDVRVNMVTPILFEQYPGPRELAAAEILEVEGIIRSTGFYRNKAKSLVGAASTIVNDFGGEVPDTMEGLLRLPGVARKTANVVLGTWFGIASGIVVDTHVSRISQRLGLTKPVPIERDLMDKLGQDFWIDFSHWVIHHGRRICAARKPKCDRCVVLDLCPYFSSNIKSSS